MLNLSFLRNLEWINATIALLPSYTHDMKRVLHVVQRLKLAPTVEAKMYQLKFKTLANHVSSLSLLNSRKQAMGYSLPMVVRRFLLSVKKVFRLPS
jgi:hypothetical protein